MRDPAENTAPVLSPQARRERNREEMRRAILDAARAVMREQGVAALSLREVARRVKLQAPSLYGYFSSKMALYDALFLEGIRTFRTYRATIDRPPLSLNETLHARLEGYMRFAQEHPELYRLCFERPVPDFVPSPASMQESLAVLAEFEQEVGATVAAEQINTGVSLSQTRDLIIAMSHGLTSLHMANEPHLPVGSGRFGGLISAAITLFEAAWEPEHRVDPDATVSAKQQDVLQRRRGGA